MLPDPLASARSLSASCTAISVVPASTPSAFDRCRHSSAASPTSPRSTDSVCTSSTGHAVACAMARTASFSLMPNSFWRYSGARWPWIR